MLEPTIRFCKRAVARFAAPPWNREHSRWQELNRQLPPDHVARKITAAMERLDWSDCMLVTPESDRLLPIPC